MKIEEDARDVTTTLNGWVRNKMPAIYISPPGRAAILFLTQSTRQHVRGMQDISLFLALRIEAIPIGRVSRSADFRSAFLQIIISQLLGAAMLQPQYRVIPTSDSRNKTTR